MSQHDEALAQITSIFAAHEGLRERWQIATPPRVGSELARADTVWPLLPFTEHARQCLVAAWEHFDVIRLAIDARRLFVTGLNGVLRGALVAASMAYWLLGPDEQNERDQRGLALTDEWYRRRIQYQTGLLSFHEQENELGSSQLERLRDDRRRANELRTGATEVQATAIIDWSAGRLWGPKSRQRKQAGLEWQRLGGDAHALGWQLMTQNVAWGDGQGLVQARVTASIVEVAHPYICAWLLFQAALDRFDQLGATARHDRHPSP